MNRWIIVGAVSGFLSVALGAFGAHALAQHLSERSLQVYQTAVQYQMYHSLALVGFGLYVSQHAIASGFAGAAGWFFLGGIVLFSGSLYAMVATDVRALGMITPIGGVLFLLGWIAFAVAAWKQGS